MNTTMKRLTVLLTVSFLAAAGCGGDDDDDEVSASAAQTCLDSWNAEANQAHQTSLAGVVTGAGIPPDELRMGTWPKPERTVSVWSAENAFGRSTGKATVATDACVLSLPESPAYGNFTFFEDQGEWQFVKEQGEGDGSTFPADAKRQVADAEEATADALGKLTLNGEASGDTGTTQEETATTADSQAAQDLEAYLKKHDVARSVSYVEAADGDLTIWTRLNAGAAPDDKPARQVCRAAIESGIPEAEGAHLLDAGAEEFFRCTREAG